MNGFVTVGQYAKVCNTSGPTMRKWIEAAQKQLKAEIRTLKIGSRTYYSRSDLDAVFGENKSD